MAQDDETPAKTHAARVRRTGIALVHAGEIVLPAVGSEAQADRVVEGAEPVVQYVFPVEIEVREAPEPIDRKELKDWVLGAVARALENS